MSINARAADPDRPVPLQGDLRELPAALAPLKKFPNWVCWKFELRTDKNGGGRWSKPPFRPQAPNQHAKNNDRTTWGTYDEALAKYEAGQCDGIGFVLPGSSIAAFDLDNCRDPATGAIAPEAMKIVDRAKSYTEITPSGKGLRVLGTGIGGAVQRKQRVPHSGVEVETYRNTARYITITGNPLPQTQPHLANIDTLIDAVVAELDGVKTHSADGSSYHTGSLDEWIEANGKKYEAADDNEPDDTYLPSRLKAVIANIPPASDLSEAFHHVVCSLHELKWSATKIDYYIDGKPVVPKRYGERLKREIYRCLHNSELKKNGYKCRPSTKAGSVSAANEGPQVSGGIPLDFYEDFDKTVAKKAIIKGVLHKGERSSWVGPPGSGKSTLLANVAIHVAGGKDWRGHRVKEGYGVVYFALERKELVKRRMRAHGLPPPPLFEIKDGALSARPQVAQTLPPNLPIAVAGKAIDLISPTCVDTIVKTIRAAEAHFGIPVGLIVIDTFNKGIALGGGDENAAKDQNIAAANLQQVQDQTDLHIALIGHTGKDESRGARGSNAHLGDVDMMVQIAAAGAVRTATVTKINDGVEGVLTRFLMVPVTLGHDEDGDAITAAIVSDEVPHRAGQKLNKTQQRAMDLLEAALSANGEPAPTTARYPKGVTVVLAEHWQDHCFRGGLSPAGTKESTRRAFRRAMLDLIDLRLINVWDERVWIVPR